MDFPQPTWPHVTTQIKSDKGQVQSACSFDLLGQNQQAIQQCFSLTTNQHQLKSACQKPSSEQGEYL
jgi:hypothetical protein